MLIFLFLFVFVAVTLLFEYVLFHSSFYRYNSADEGFDGTYHTNVVVRSNGSCLYVPPGNESPLTFTFNVSHLERGWASFSIYCPYYGNHFIVLSKQMRNISIAF